MEYLLLIVIALLAAVLVMQAVLMHRQRETTQAQAQQDQQQSAYLQRFGDDVFDELSAQWDASMQELQRMSDRQSVVQSQLSQSQTTLLESIQRQLLMSARNQEERIGQMSTGVNETLAQLDSRMEQVRQATSTGMETLRQENARQLTDMRRSMDERLTQSLDKRLNESFALVSQRLEQVYKGLGEMQTLATGVGDLKRVLTNVKTRGIWGEM